MFLHKELTFPCLILPQKELFGLKHNSEYLYGKYIKSTYTSYPESLQALRLFLDQLFFENEEMFCCLW